MTDQPADPLRANDRVECICGHWPMLKNWSNHLLSRGNDGDHAMVRAADHATLGYWFARVEAALPTDTNVSITIGRWLPIAGEDQYGASSLWSERPGKHARHHRAHGDGPTPEAALEALHAALTSEEGK